MKVECWFCGRTAELDDPRAEGWYTHQLTTTTGDPDRLVGGTLVPDDVSMGYACPTCVAAPERTTREADHDA